MTAVDPPVARPGRRALPVLAVLGLLALSIVISSAAPAGAHASVLTTDPADGQSVPEPPANFLVNFSEAVDTQLGGLSVLDSDGNRVDLDDTTSEDGGRLLRVGLEPDLAEGTYVGTWRVVSADGHPISGSVLFAVGTVVDPSGLDALTARTDPGWEVAGTVARFVTFVAALLAAGLGFFLAFVHDQRRDRWTLAPVVRLATLVGLFGIVATIGAQAALATGRGLDAVTDIDVIRTVLTESLGWQAVVLLIGLALVHLSTDTQKLLVAQGCAFYGGLAVSVSFVLWGHATEAPYRWLSVLSDGTHVAAAAVWFGGLVGLALTLRRRSAALAGAPDPDLPARPEDPDGTTTRSPSTTLTLENDLRVTTAPRTDQWARRDLLRSTAVVVGRFSTAATVAVVGVLLTGLAMTWIQSGGSLSALWSTTYGRLLLTKVALVAAVVVLGGYNRQRLVPALSNLPDPRRDEEDPTPTLRTGEHGSGEPTHAPGDATTSQGWSRLRRTLVVEIVALFVVLALTAVLVNVTPARTAADDRGGTISLQGDAADGTVQLTVDPARAGTNTLRVQYLDGDGRPRDVATDLRVEFRLPAADLGPISREVVKIGPGTFVVEGSELSIPGRWEIALAVRPSDFREVRTPFVVDIP